MATNYVLITYLLAPGSKLLYSGGSQADTSSVQIKSSEITTSTNVYTDPGEIPIGGGGIDTTRGTYHFNSNPRSTYGSYINDNYGAIDIYFHYENDPYNVDKTTREYEIGYNVPTSGDTTSMSYLKNLYRDGSLWAHGTNPARKAFNVDTILTATVTKAEQYYGYSKTLRYAPSKTGYVFKYGYCYGGPYTGNTYNAGASFSVGTGSAAGSSDYYTNHYFRAEYRPIEYTIKYNPNGGSGTAWTTNSIKYNTDITISSNTGAKKFTREGYEFKGGNTKSDGTGESYTAGSTQSNLSSIDGAVVDLYAIWDVIGYDVVYNKNTTDEVTNMPKDQKKIAFKNLTLSKEIPKRNSKVETATVTYINDGGTPIDKGTVTKTTTYTINKEGYYWNTNKGGTGTTYKPGAEYTENKALTLYAKWYSSSNTVSVTIPTAVHGNTSETKKVIFDPNGGNVNPSSKNYTVTTVYKFKNGTTQAGGKGTIYNAGDKYSKIVNLVLYANYTATRTSEKIILPTPTKSGSVFKGWYNSANKLVGIGGDSYTPSVDGETLTAQWYAGTMVNFHPDNGKADYSIMIPYNQNTYYTLTLPNKPGYYFDGGIIDNGPLKGKFAYNGASSTTCTGNVELKTMWKNKAWIYTDTPTLDLTAKWVHADSFVFFGRNPGEDLTNGYWCPIQGYIYDGSKGREIKTFKVFDGDFGQEGGYHGN